MTDLDHTVHGAAVLPIDGTGLVIRRGGRRLLDGASLTIGQGGRITVIIGPNGAGKSLLIRTLAGLVTPDDGCVTWAGTPPDLGRVRNAGFVFQRPVMLRRSALANVAFGLELGGMRRAEAHRIAAADLERAGLSHISATQARALSGGEQQRLALARALVLEPEVLFLDEPAANLDPHSTAAIEARVREAAQAGMRIILVTQDLAQARRIADDVFFVDRGQVREHTTAEAFFHAPATPETRRFLAGELLV